jgi:hypothetical protein
MGCYSFDQRCRPRGDFRIPEIKEFLHLLKDAFLCSTFYDSNGRTVNLSEIGLQTIFEKAAKELSPGLGAVVHFFTLPPRRKDHNTVRIEIQTGNHPGKIFIDSYDISIGDGSKVPDFDYFEKFIETFRPFEAFLAESDNEYGLDSYDRQQGTRFKRPVIIRGFHYLDKGMADSIGGIKYCLKAPAWRVRRFCEGVLIQLVPGLFYPENPDHLQIQEDAMAYFKML